MVKPTLLIAVGTIWCTALSAQNIALFTVDQPAQFVVDAGADQDYMVGLVIGGVPTATGGGANYTFSWEPASSVSDPTLANPTVISLSGDQTFTVTVTDVASGCVKTDEVLVEINNAISRTELSETQLFPNPTSGMIQLASSEIMEQVSIRSISGSTLLQIDKLLSKQTTIDLTRFSEGFYFVDVTFSNGHTQTFKLCRASSAY